jgi:hypothetical protein
MTPAGWYADPQDASMLRYWDGGSWTPHTSPNAAHRPIDVADYIRRDGDRAVVVASAVAAGLVPDRCVAHGRTGGAAPMRFTSRTPIWVFLTVFAGLIWPFVIALILRKTVSAQAWPVCSECHSERRTNLVRSWACLAFWIPAFLLCALLPASLPAVATFTMVFLAALGPLIAGVWFADRARLEKAVGGVVSADGSTVSFPAPVFYPSASARPAGVATSSSH